MLNIYDYSEVDEIIEKLDDSSFDFSFAEALEIVKSEMPFEGFQTIQNAAEALYLRS